MVDVPGSSCFRRSRYACAAQSPLAVPRTRPRPLASRTGLPADFDTIFSHRFAVANGVRLHYVIGGPADGELVVLLHGWPQTWYTWRRVMPELAKGGLSGRGGRLSWGGRVGETARWLRQGHDGRGHPGPGSPTGRDDAGPRRSRHRGHGRLRLCRAMAGRGHEARDARRAGARHAGSGTRRSTSPIRSSGISACTSSATSPRCSWLAMNMPTSRTS